jgi:hypothetical protein
VAHCQYGVILLTPDTFKGWRRSLGLTRAKAEALLNEFVSAGLATFDTDYGGQTVVRPTEQGKREGRAS